MADVEVRDAVIWLRHVRGDTAVRERLERLQAGEVTTLLVDGMPGRWEKMRDGTDGRPTQGLRPLGGTSQWWNKTWPARKGALFTLELGTATDAPADEFMSAQLVVGRGYTRQELAELLGIHPTGMGSGVFKARGSKSVLLFVTETKTADRTQYNDYLEEDGMTLHWEGQTQRRTDPLVITHKAQGLELLVFYRRRKDELPGYGFRYLGRFEYESHDPTQPGPSRFILRRVGADRLDTIAPEEENSSRSSAPARASYQRYVESYELQVTPKHHELQTRFQDWLAAQGAAGIMADQDRVDLRFTLAERGPVLAEIKPCEHGQVRFAIRTAMGQLLDYRQTVPGDPALLVVVGTKPVSPRDAALAKTNGFALAYPHERQDGFAIVWP